MYPKFVPMGAFLPQPEGMIAIGAKPQRIIRCAVSLHETCYKNLDDLIEDVVPRIPK